MTRTVIAGIIAFVLGAILLCAGGLAAVLGGGGGIGGSGCVVPLGDTPPTISPPPGGWQPTGRFDTEQVGHAATIAQVGAGKGVPIWGWAIATATALQESDLRNLAGGHLDSIGLFQQRPSQGWGTPEQLRDPVYAAGAFYDKLLTIPGWQAMPLTEAAQAVQHSAYPDAYAKHEPDALRLVSQVIGLVDDTGNPLLVCAGAGGPWTQPVIAAVVSGFRTAERPSHDGVDLGAARGTPIKAASTGTVIVVRCNITAGTSCDVDGGSHVRGCGWYVDIQHEQGILTRYCHMLTEPAVTVGQHVAVGDIIGLVGSSGHSSGPHLHYEVHTGASGASSTAIDPVSFMQQVGAPLASGG
ncbi:MAG: M23 family metallopeptidase [Dactylosporangium sp.]|nr:M23 family metallopeptidase [Dactylosporangium sp.]NNJ62331.1 M23 family metallopeptidase [Dactylosporangium sp.]